MLNLSLHLETFEMIRTWISILQIFEISRIRTWVATFEIFDNKQDCNRNDEYFNNKEWWFHRNEVEDNPDVRNHFLITLDDIYGLLKNIFEM